MKKLSLGFVAGLSLAFTAAVVAPTAAIGQQVTTETFNRAAYDSIAKAGSNETVPDGTRVTAQNWPQYQKFLSLAMRAFFSGKYFWRAEPDFYLEVGPTRPLPPPLEYRQDTEKYSQASKLVPVGEGAYTVTGYVAGQPFPSVAEPNKAEKILYNAYYQYAPAVLWNTWPGFQIDKYMNISPAVSQIVYFNLAHNSDPGFPRANPTSHGYFYSEWVQQLLPEQSKYQTALILLPDDPARGQELYVFLPSLRRSLRLSASARCAPIAGTDWANDDSKDGMNRIPTQFTADLIGEKKILALVHEDGALRGDPKNFYTGHSAPFHRAVTGKWELRDVWVVDEVPRASMVNGYCYSHDVFYIDKELYAVLQNEYYDRSGKLWKIQISNRTQDPVEGFKQDRITIPAGDEPVWIYDLQNSHVSYAYPQGYTKVDNNVPAQLRDVSIYALPSGLTQIMR
ncbi:MAG TPA: DUF1329 domain-containing protein [Candidatus Binataceae bacterium]|nr:DUF1329 domain-containing protein [Candidatus Binataceae bacterium]